MTQANTITTAAITVIRDRMSRGMAEVPGTEGAALADALTREWPCDAHFTAYEPMALPVKGTDRTAVVRLLHERDTETERPSYYDVREDLELPPVQMQVLVGDVDGPGHTATAEWRTETEAKLNASGMAWYATRNGYRVLMPLPTPFQISEPAHAESWKALYLGWCEYIEQTHGIALDRKCKDWTRLMRLPNVRRDGRDERSAVHNLEAPRVFDFESTWVEPPNTAVAPRATPADATQIDASDERMARAIAVAAEFARRANETAERLPSSVSGHGGDEALMIAAREVATHLGDDEAGILEVLRSTFNPRCVPPWADGKLQREARNAAERQRKPENRWAHRREEKRVIEELRAENDNDAGAFRGAGEGSTIDSTVDGLRFGTLSPNPRRQTYLIPEMEIGVGRPWGWLGKTNASKTIVIQQLEVDLAMGRPIFGKFAGPGRPVRVLHIAYEGYTKAEEDYVRLLRGTGEDLDYDQLNHYLQFAEGRRLLSGDPDETREWLLRRLEGFKGGLCVIDPLVAACRGLDENATEIADPIYALESVSKESGVAIIVAHHFGHGEKRSRGSSAIEGAFGATAYIEQFADKDGLLIPSRFNERAVHGGKRNRMGCADFELTIHDTTEDGKPWIATPEALKAGDASWALRIAASDAPFLVRRSKDARDAAKHMANIAETEQRIVTALGRAEQPWAGMTITKLRDHCSAGPDTIKEAIRRLEDAGTVVPCDLGSERYAKWRLSESELEKQGIPRAGKYSRGPLPIPGEVARAQ